MIYIDFTFKGFDKKYYYNIFYKPNTYMFL